MSATTSNTFEFRLPDIGEGTVDGEIVAWLIKPGDTVREDQPMFEIMTDKATVEIPAPRKGTIKATFGKAGEIVKVGDVIVVIELAAGETAPAISPHGHGASKPAPEAKAEPVEVAPHPVQGVTALERGGRVLATPATRKVARELGIDIVRVPGTGPHHRVTKADVQSFYEGGAPAKTPLVQAAASTALEERVPLRGLRKKIAEKMVQSKFTAPHFTYMEELDVTQLIAVRASTKKAAEAQGVKLTYLPFVMKAVVAALKKFPTLNASLDDEKNEVVLKKYYNLGIAVASENGLIVPVIKDVDKKTLLQLAKEVAEVAERARIGRNNPDELKGGTFTLSSIGSVGGLFATPIINHPEVGILAIMKIQERPVVRGGQIVVGQMMNLALSFDHRVVDGSVGADFTNEVIRYLENPSLLMLEMV